MQDPSTASTNEVDRRGFTSQKQGAEVVCCQSWVMPGYFSLAVVATVAGTWPLPFLHKLSGPLVACLCLLSAAGFLSVDAQQPAVAPIRVSTEDQLVAAYRLGRPILVTKSIFLGGPLPPVNHSLSISGDPSTCPREKVRPGVLLLAHPVPCLSLCMAGLGRILR